MQNTTIFFDSLKFNNLLAQAIAKGEKITAEMILDLQSKSAPDRHSVESDLARLAADWEDAVTEEVGIEEKYKEAAKRSEDLFQKFQVLAKQAAPLGAKIPTLERRFTSNVRAKYREKYLAKAEAKAKAEERTRAEEIDNLHQTILQLREELKNATAPKGK